LVGEKLRGPMPGNPEIEAFVRRIVAKIEAAEAAGLTEPQAIAEHFNATGITTRKGRGWNGVTVAKFLSSPGARRYRSDGDVDAELTGETDG
jgi:hypothetical protein